MKLGSSPDITADSVAKHLESGVEGTWTEFNDAVLSEISDVPKIKKIYKLQDPTNRGRKDDDVVVDKAEMEVAVLGLMALRGAS